MKYLILILFFIPCLAFGQAKSIDYKFGTPYQVINTIGDRYYSNNELGVTFVCKKSTKIFFLSYDTNTMKEISRRESDDFSIWDLYTLHFVWKKNKLFCFYTRKDAQKGQFSLCFRELDYKTCQFIGKEKKLFSCKNMLYSQGSSCFFTSSKDNSKLLIYGFVDRSKSQDSKRDVFMCVLDENLNKLSYNLFQMPYSWKEVSYESFMINSDGIPYMLNKVYTDNSDPNNRKEIQTINKNYDLILHKFNGEEKTFTSKKMPSNKYFIQGMALFESKNKKTILAGYYYLNNGGKDKIRKEANLNGFYLSSFDPEIKTYEEKIFPFSKKLLSQWTPAKKNYPELNNLKIYKYLEQEDNSVIIIGEKLTYDEVQLGKSYDCLYGSILVTKIDKQQNIEWMRKLPKRQNGCIGRGSMTETRMDMSPVSFNHLSFSNHQYFIYSDHSDNAVLTDNEFPEEKRIAYEGILCLYEVNNTTGAINKKVIFNMEKKVKELKLYNHDPQKLMYLSNDELILEFYKKKKENIMVKIKLRD